MKKPSYATSRDLKSGLGDMIAGHAAERAGLSGFYIFKTGGESLEGRLFLIRSAEKTLDLQYYAISEGISSNVLIEALIRAADRGVRVRLIVDDVTTGQVRRDLITLDEIPNIEIRIFNPVNKHDQSTPARILAAILHRERATRRMHNKALIADNQMAIVGGRNLGDEYFETHEEMSFKDIDVLSAGPVVAKISGSFDEFWNDDHAYPVLQLYKKRTGHKAIQDIRIKLKRNWQKFIKRFRNGKPQSPITPLESEKLIGSLVWAQADLVTDPSAKVQGGENFSPPLLRLKEIVDSAKEEFVIISAYFVPRDRGVAWLSSLCERGMRVKVLTNSLASTDVVAVHTGYGKHRISLLEKGVAIYELKPRNDKRTRQRLIGHKAPSYASLHAKAYIVDREYAVIGSFNFDPRSAYLNTELGLFIHSPELAQQLHALFDESTAPQASYKLGLAPSKKLTWTTREDGQDIRYVSEPQVSPWRVLQAFLISFLPVEDQL